jgi:tetratricopeptide (TPR) repeat protein
MNRVAKIGGVLLACAALAFAQAQPKPKSQKEVEAIKAIFNAQTPDARIAAVDDLLSKFADTEFKAIALRAAAEAAQQKGDTTLMIVYAERALEADPKDYASMLMIATSLAQKTREFDLDKEEKLSRAEKLAKDGIELSKNAVKPNPGIPDDQWEKEKKYYQLQGHTALALVASVRKKPDVAIAEYKAAVDAYAPDQEQTVMIRLAAAYNEAHQPDQALAEIDKINALPNLNPTVKQIASQERAKAMRAKGGAAAAPASAPAPAASPAATPAPTPSAPPK